MVYIIWRYYSFRHGVANCVYKNEAEAEMNFLCESPLDMEFPSPLVGGGGGV